MEKIATILIDNILINGWTWFSVLFLVFVLYVWKPESFEKMFSHILKMGSYFSDRASKAYIKHDVQSRMNSFIKRMDKKVHSFSPVKIDVKFFNPDTDSDKIESYLNNGKYFIRAKKTNNPNNNFVNVAMAFIAENLLKEAKCQISKKQKTTIDLFVGKKLFQEEKEEVMHEFISDFLHPESKDGKNKDYLIKFAETDRAGLFFPILLEELTFLGKKVFAEPKNNKVQEEVSNLINFLHEHANRKQGEDMNNDRFIAEFSQFAFMIVGKKKKVDTGKLQAYKKYLKTLMDRKIENIYLIGNERIQDFINQVSPDDFLRENKYFLYKRESYQSELKKQNGTLHKTKTYLLLIRKRNIDPIILKS